MPSTGRVIFSPVDGIDFHGFSIKYNETGDLYSHRFHYEYGLMDCSVIIYQTIQSYSLVNHFRRITGAINQITIFIEHHRSNIYNNSNADTNG